MKQQLRLLFVVSVLAGFVSGTAQAAVTVTAATGGTGISADSAQNGVAPAFTTLGNIVITEGANGDFAAGTARTLILTAPAGWQFNAGVGTAIGAKVSGSGGNEVTVNSISVTSSNITVNFDVSGTGNINSLTISGIQVRATEGGTIPSSGTILRTSGNPGNATINGIVNNTTSFGSLSQAVGALRLYTILPPQTFTDAGTVAGSGISGPPDAQTAGVAFDLTKLVAADREFNISSTYSGSKTISYTGPGGTPTYTTAVVFTNGQSSNTLTTTLPKIETTTITATDGTVAGIASSNLTVTVGPFVKLQLLVPGETPAAGTASGKTGTPADQTNGVAFTVTVNAVDDNWNIVSTVTDTVGIASSDGLATLPADAALVSGTNSFSVTLATVGTQTLTATNITDGTKSSDTSPPITVQQPGTTTALISSANPSCFGQSVTFTATVTVKPPSTGTPTGTVDFKDGATVIDSEFLDGSGQASFSTSLLAGGAHSITAVYSGDANFSGSTSLVLTQTVNTPPSITLDPTNRTVCAGSSVSFSAAASSSPAPAVQWRASGDGGFNFTNIPGATSTTYTFTSALADDGKLYHALFTNVCGAATSGDAVLTVNALANCSISGAAAVCASSTNNVYSGTAGLSGYRWSISGNGTITGATNAEAVSVTAGTTTTFTLTLTLTNASGCTSTCTKIVTNLPRPTATVSGGGTICSPNSTNIQAALTGTGPWTVAWSDGFITNAASSPAVRSVSPASTTIYNVTNVTDANCASVGTGSATVTVNIAPQITLNPVNLTVCASNSVTFTATASGIPAPAIQWQVSTNGGSSFSNITSQTSTSYTFTATLNDSNRQYRARFTNSCGTVFSTAATLTVNPRPTATVSGTTAICLGNSTTIQAVLGGTAPWTVVWSDGVTNSGVASSPLTRSVSPSSTTTYTVTLLSDGAGNCTNSGTGSAVITVNTAPSIAVNTTNRTVCAGSSVSLVSTSSGSPTPAVLWQASGDGGLNFTNIPGVTSTAYSFTSALADDGKQYHAVFSNVCGSATSSNATLTVNAVPVCGITGTDRICTNSAGNIYVGPDSLAGYRWSISGNGAISGDTNAQSVSVTAGATTTFTLTLTTTNASGCTTICSKIVTNVARPTATVSGGGTICLGGSVNLQAALTGTGPWNVQWSDGAVQFNVATSPATRSVSPGSTTIYTVTSVETGDCFNTGTGSATVTVNTPPLVTLNPVDATVCASNSVTFTATASGSPTPAVQWQVSTNGGLSFSNITGQTSTSYNFTTALSDSGKQFRARFTNSCGTVFSTAATLTVNPRPTATVSGTATICAGNSTTIQAVLGGTAPWTVVWSDGVTNSGVASSPLTRSVSPSSTTTYTVTLLSDGAGNCTNFGTGSAVITVNTAPSVTVNPTNQTVCAGTSISLVSTASGTPAPGIQWQASGDGGLNFTNVPGATSTTYTFTAALADDGKQYHVVFTNVCGTATSSNATLTVNAVPGCGITGADRVCTNSAGNIYVGPDSLAGYRWSVSGNGTISSGTNAQSVSVTAGATTTFTLTLTVTNASGCTTTCSKIVTNVARPTATVSGGGTICSGNSVNIQAALTGTGPWNVQWSDGAVQFNVAASPATRSVSPASTTIYTVTSVESGDCFNTGAGSATVTVNTAPLVTINPVDATVCVSNSVTFTATASGTPAPAVQWQVSTNGGASFSNITSQTSTSYTFTAALTDNNRQYRARFTNSCGTVFSTAATLTVNPAPTATVSGTTAICLGNSTTIQAALGGTAPWTVVWSDGVTNASVVSSPLTRSVSPASTTTYSVTLVSDANCTNSGTGSAVITVNTPSSVTINPTNRAVCAGTSISLVSTASGSPAPAVQWQASGDGGLNFTNVPGANSTTYTFTAALADDGKQYHAVFTNVCGTATSSNATLTVNALPACGITGADRVCTNTTDNLYFAPLALPNYGWTISGNGTINGVTNSQTVNITAGLSGTFTLTLTLTNANGCTSTCSKIVTNVPKPTATVSGSGAICPGGTNTIQAVLTGSGPWTVAWSDGVTQTNVAASPAVRSVSPLVTTVYSVTSVTDANCANAGAGSATVTVNSPPSVTLNPTNQTVCSGTVVSFSATASGSPAPAVQWQVSTNGGLNFVGIGGATNTTYTFTSAVTDNTNRYRARFTNVCGTVLSAAATLTVYPTPSAVINADSTVCANSTGNSASVAGAGSGASYAWTISGGSITAGAGTTNITYSAGGGTVQLGVTVSNAFGCQAVGNKTVAVVFSAPIPNSEAWATLPTPGWDSSTLGTGDHAYAEGNSIPFRFQLTGLCAREPFCIVIRYDFKDGNTERHFMDFLTTYNSSESTVSGHACDNETCTSGPNLYPIPADTNLSYQFPGNFTVYNGTITNVSGYTSFVGTTVEKELTISGVVADGSGTKDVLVLFGGHLARENEWGLNNGASHFPGASAKMLLKFCSESSFNNLGINPGGIIQQADVGITKSVNFSQLCAGNNLTYTLRLTNEGPNQATGVTVLDSLPPGTALVSATPSQGTFTGTSNLNFALGAINAGSNATITIVAAISSNAPAGVITNTATVSAASPADPNLLNNTASATTQVFARTTVSSLGAQQACLNYPFEFTAAAAGTGPLSYQWTRNGTNLAGATDSAYNIASVQASDTGSYCVIVAGFCNVVTNCGSLAISTNSATTSLVDQTRCPGENATFSTTPAGGGPFTIVWRKDGVAIPGATNTSLTLSNVTATNAAVYCVEVLGTCNVSNNCATLTVLTNTTVAALTNQTQCVGGTATFTALASGSGPFTYAWFKGTNALASATNSSLVLSNLTGTDTGNYCVVVTGACQSATNCATLTVNPPNTVDPLVSLTNCPGATVSFTAVANGSGPFTYQWLKTGAPLADQTNSSLTLTNIADGDGGEYAVAVAGACNSVTNFATLTVLTNVSATQPADLVLCEGSPATFSTLAGGSGPFTYQWTRGGVPLAGATESAFSIASITPSDAGVYCVQVTGACGSVTNCATLTLLPGTATTPVGNQTLCSGGTAAFATLASGTGPFTYQWTRAGTPLAGATRSSLTLTNVATADAGQYCVQVTGACGSVTNCALLAVLTNTAATPLGDLVLCPGSTASFSTLASGTGPFSYQWTKAGAPLGGATSSSLTLSNITAADAAQYCVQVTGACGSVTNCATLTMLTNVTATALGDLAQCPGSTATFSTVAGGSGPFSYLWTKAGAPLAGATSNSLTLTNITSANAAQYCVQVTGACGSVTNCATLTVLTNTTATSLSNLTLCAGSTAMFSTVAGGTGPFGYQWTKAGAPLAGATDSSLTITNITSADAAQYCVRVTGACGSVTNCATLAMLTNVTATPLGDLVLCPGATASFSTVAGGTGPFSYQWSKGGSPLTGATNSSLTLTNLASSDAGQYCVQVSSLCGSASQCATLTVLTNTTATSLTSQTNCPGTSASFSTVASGTGPFSYQWTKDGGALAGATNSSLTLNNLNATNAGQYCVIVTGNCNSVTNCATLTVLTNTTATSLTSLTNCPGSSASFSTVAGGTGPFSYQWTKDGGALAGATNSALTLNNLSAANAGQYCVIVTGNCNLVTNCATLTVLTNTTATILTSLTNCPGGSASFSTVAGGTGPFSYQWTKNGGALAGATNSSLTLNNLSATNAGQYCVIVTGNCNLVTNCATLTVLTNTTASALSSLTVVPGQPAVFSTTADGTGPFTYQWTKNGTNIAAANTSSYAIAAVSNSDAGTYCVIVGGACGGVTNCATLTVLSPGLTVTKACPPTLAIPGGTLVISGTVSNAGGVTLTNVVVTNTMAALGNVSRRVLGPITLAPGIGTNFNDSYTLPLDSCGPYVDILTARGADMLAGNLLTASDTKACPGTNSPSITVTRNCPAVPVAPGQLAAVSGVVSNAGNITLTNVLVWDDQPATNTLVLGPLALAPGQSVVFSNSYLLPSNCCTYVGVVRASGRDKCFGRTVTDSASSACQTTTDPKLTVTRTCPPLPVPLGQPLVFSGIVSNAGNITLTNVTVVNDQPSNNTPVLGPIILAPGEQANFTGSFLVPNDICATNILSTVTARGITICSGTNVSASQSALCPIQPAPRLVVTKNCPASPVPPGGLLAFSGTVSNAGNVTLTNVLVVNNQPTNNTPVLGPFTLAPHQATNFSGSYRVCPLCCPPYRDTITATGAQICNGSNVLATATASCPGLTTPRLSLRVDCPPGPTLLGQLVLYSGSVSNSGDVMLGSVLVTDNQAGFVAQISALAPAETADFFGVYLATNCAPNPLTLVTATAFDVCTGGSVSNQVGASCAVLCPPTEPPVLINPMIVGGQFKFSFATESGRTYAVQYTDAMQPVNWLPLTNFVGNGSIVTITDPMTNQKRFYRVLVQ